MDADLIAVFDTRLLDIRDPVLIRVNLLFFFRGLIETGMINEINKDLSRLLDSSLTLIIRELS